jgi:hypothetical protein
LDIFEQLHASLDTRMTPEAVCALICAVPSTGFMPAQRRMLERVARTRAGHYSSMGDDFERPVPADHKVRVLLALVGKEVPKDVFAQLAGDPWMLAGQLQMLMPGPPIQFADRMTRRELAAAEIPVSKRRYNRMLRHVARTRARVARLKRQILIRQLILVGRSGLAYSITVDEMRADPAGACFVAYWSAQRNRRREFTTGSKPNPFDQIAGILLGRCQQSATTDWWMIAHARPSPGVVAQLSDMRQGELMGQWFGFMRLAAELLREAYASWPTVDVEPILPDIVWAARPGLMPPAAARGAYTSTVIRLDEMVVRPGVDSSTWNTLASAYNQARAGWINCLEAAGALDLLDAVCPGKVMRLMAGDLVSLHQRGGGGLDPETRVWAALPLPWDVLTGEVCTAETVEQACAQQGVNAWTEGWTAPREAGPEGQWQPTPDLVHGVEIADPLWAGLLRRAGVFSGQGLRPDGRDLVDEYAAVMTSGGTQ